MTHDRSEVESAEPAGADLVVFGRLFDTRAKRILGPRALAQACFRSIPIIALGGIDNRDVASCVRMGAYRIAAIRSAVAVDDARSVLKRLLSVRFRPAFDRPSTGLRPAFEQQC